MINRRMTLAAALILALGLTLTGCMNSTTRDAQPAPTATADFMPGATDGGQGVNNPAATIQPTVTDQNGMIDGNGMNGAGTAGNGNNGNTGATSNGALNPFDWANGASQIEQAIARISEIAESRVVVANSTALVGVRFDNVYKGQLTERIRQMVAAEVMRADPTIQTVAVTSDAGDVQKVYQLSDQIRAGRTASELSQEINAIVRNATTLR
ncbi:MAG: YhcN/YlaJ family sporulation lipoprotein [Clostridia bacterium]|nr:YhcN/YlaJ family sporulation lipoprotein [Clostridia bacterium]